MNVQQAENASRSFRLAFDRCMEQQPLPGGKFEILVSPAVVALAFSIELGIKALLLRAGGPARGHDLAALVKQLPDENKQQLIAATGLAAAEFDDTVASHARTFEEWRYVYELESVAANLAFLRGMSTGVQELLARNA